MSARTTTQIPGFRGDVIVPDHLDYDDARAVWNGIVDRRPRLIARCSGTADVAAVVRFARDADLEIVAEAGSGAEAVEKVFEHEPDVVLLDVRMPGNSGIEACTAIKEKAPRTKILILTASDEESDLFSAIKAGASGYLLKDLPTEEIAEAAMFCVGGNSGSINGAALSVDGGWTAQ